MVYSSLYSKSVFNRWMNQSRLKKTKSTYYINISYIWLYYTENEAFNIEAYLTKFNIIFYYTDFIDFIMWNHSLGRNSS